VKAGSGSKARPCARIPFPSPPATFANLFAFCESTPNNIGVLLLDAGDFLIERLFSIVVGGYTCDVLFIAANRRLLRWCGSARYTFSIIVSMILSCTIGLALTIIPDYFAGPFLFDPRTWQQHELGVFLLGVSVSTRLNFLVGSVFFILAGTLLLHRLCWPNINRALYAIASRVGMWRGLFGVSGIMLLTVAFGKVPESVMQFLKAFVK
jgi:hypothetical protein